MDISGDDLTSISDCEPDNMEVDEANQNNKRKSDEYISNIIHKRVCIYEQVGSGTPNRGKKEKKCKIWRPFEVSQESVSEVKVPTEAENIQVPTEPENP